MNALLLDAVGDSGPDSDKTWDEFEDTLYDIEKHKQVAIDLINGWIHYHKILFRVLSDWKALGYAQGAIGPSGTYKWPEFSIRKQNGSVQFVRDETLFLLLDLEVLNSLQFDPSKQQDDVVVLSSQEFAVERSELVTKNFPPEDFPNDDATRIKAQKDYAKSTYSF